MNHKTVIEQEAHALELSRKRPRYNLKVALE
uniref:Uncharacterized protein n=1 Tax=Rhizophora mucronata TaxID=61149 RepID=A0A2P2NZK2_RHIMU